MSKTILLKNYTWEDYMDIEDDVIDAIHDMNDSSDDGYFCGNLKVTIEYDDPEPIKEIQP